MKQAKFEDVEIGLRFIPKDNRRYAKIKECVIEGQMRNAVCMTTGWMY